METELLQSLKLNFSFLDIFLYPIVIWNNDKLIVYCNSYFQKLTEYSKEEIENKMSIEDFISGKFINAKNEGNISQIIATIYINKEKKKRNFFIIDNKINENLNLSIIVDSINGKPILDNNQFINDIFLSIPDIMFVVNKSLIVEYVNYKNSDLNLRNPSEIENKHIDNLKLPKAIIKKYKKQLEKTEDNPSCENYQLVLNKRLFYFEIRIIKSNSKYISIV